MLYDVFCTAIKMSITASVTGVIVLSLKALLQKMKFSRSVLMILYLLIAFRLICPCVPQSSFSVFNLANSSVNREEVIAGQNFSAKQIYYGDNSKKASAQKGSDTARL